MIPLRRLRSHYPVAGLLAALIGIVTWQFAIAQEATKNFIMHAVSKPVAAINFEDAEGQIRTLADFRGKVVVLNIWATWCVPCRKEMPALDRLQAALGGSGFAVVPVSIDRGGIEVVSKFYAETGVTHLAKYIDTSGKAVRELGVVGVPATLIVNRAGNEVGRVIGPAAWDAPEIINLLKSVMAKPSNPNERADRNARTAAEQHGTPGPIARGVQWLKALFK